MELSNESTRKYYSKLLDYHNDNRDLAKKVRDFQHDMEHYILREVTGRKYFYDIWDEKERDKPKWQRTITEKGQLTWLNENNMPMVLISNIQNLKVHRNVAEHKNEMDPITYMHCFQTMVKTIQFFSVEPVPKEIENILYMNNLSHVDIHPNILKRIKEPIENDLYVLNGTKPIVYYGDYKLAKACTISVYPSYNEFITDKNNKTSFLYGKLKRFCSRAEFKKEDFQELTDDDAKTVLDYCDKYFKQNPNKQFFNLLDYFLRKFGYSYYESNKMEICVNLNLTQWALDPDFKDLNEESKKGILRQHFINDLYILKTLIDNKNFEMIFLNGKSAVENFEKCFDFKLLGEKVESIVKDGKSHNVIRYVGNYKKNTKIIGWNLFITNDPLNNEKSIDEFYNSLRLNDKNS